MAVAVAVVVVVVVAVALVIVVVWRSQSNVHCDKLASFLKAAG